MGEAKRTLEWYVNIGTIHPDWIARRLNVPREEVEKKIMWRKLTKCKKQD